MRLYLFLWNVKLYYFSQILQILKFSYCSRGANRDLKHFGWCISTARGLNIRNWKVSICDCQIIAICFCVQKLVTQNGPFVGSTSRTPTRRSCYLNHEPHLKNLLLWKKLKRKAIVEIESIWFLLVSSGSTCHYCIIMRPTGLRNLR